MYTSQGPYLFWPDYAVKDVSRLEEMFHHVGRERVY